MTLFCVVLATLYVGFYLSGYIVISATLEIRCSPYNFSPSCSVVYLTTIHMTVSPLESSLNENPDVFASPNDEYLPPNIDDTESHLLYLFQEWLEFVKANHSSQL